MPELPPLRVLMVTNRYFPEMGGIETHVYEVARRLAARNVAITVLTTDRTGALPRAESLEGVRIVRVPAYPANRDYYFAPAIVREIRRGAWDLVHVQGFHALVPPIAMLAAWRIAMPYVITSHTGGHSSGLRNAARGLQWAALRPLFAHAERIITVSRFETRTFADRLHLSPNHFTMIRNGSHLPPIPTDVPAPEATLLISIGRLERYKGHHRAIEAMPHVLTQVPDAHLLILGSGPYEEELRRIAQRHHVSDRVTIRTIPPTQRQELAIALSQASVVMLLSEYEAHPVSVMEALALGRPVLVANTSGLTELADDGLVRAVALDSSAADIASGILRQLRDPLVPAGFTLPSWDECAMAVYNVYTQVLGRPPCES